MINRRFGGNLKTLKLSCGLKKVSFTRGDNKFHSAIFVFNFDIVSSKVVDSYEAKSPL